MTLLIKGFLVLTIVTSLHFHAFSQSSPSAQSLYDAGVSELKRNPDKAFEHFKASMEIALQRKEWDTYINAVNQLAALNLEGDEVKKEQVFAWLKQAVEVTKDLKESPHLAMLHFNLAELYNLAFEIELPILHYKKAMAIWVSLSGELNANVAACYHGLGDVYKYNKFDFFEAEKCYEKALSIREEINLQDTKTLYRNYYSLAATNRSQLDFEKALAYGSKTLTLAAQLKPVNVEMSNAMVGNIYREMGQTEEAKNFLFKALELNEATDDLTNRAWYYLCLGENFKYDSSYDESLTYLKKAYALYIKPDIKDQTLFVNLLIDLLDVYSLLDKERNFRDTIREILKELSGLDRLHSREAAETWGIVGVYHHRKMNYDSALFYYQKALIASSSSFNSMSIWTNPSEENIGFMYRASEILAKKASVMKDKFSLSGEVAYLNQSLFCLRLAEKLVSKQRNTLDLESSKWEFLEGNYDLYDNIISNLNAGIKKLPDDTLAQLAFQYFEQSKSRSIADALIQTERTKQISDKDSLFRLHAELKRQLFVVQDAINIELDNAKGSEKVSGLRTEMVAIDQKIQVCKLAIEENYPGYFNVKYGYGVVALSDIQKLMKAKEKVLLEYFWGSESVYALAINDHDVFFRRIGSSDTIALIIDRLLLHLTDAHSSMSPQSFALFTENSHQLYQILLEPFKSLLSGRRRIQVIPDGSISQVPFETLLEASPTRKDVDYRSLQYLIKSFTISYAYSSVMLRREIKESRVVDPSLLAVGFTGGQEYRQAATESAVIKGVEEEIKSLEERFNAGKFLVGDEATESNFKTFAPDFDILHLAVHGTGDVKRNLAASLYFGKKMIKKMANFTPTNCMV